MTRKKEEVLAPDGKLPRITFEVVLEAQNQLLEFILRLVRENRTLREEEDIEFLTLYWRATLGHGAFVRIRIPVEGGAEETSLDGVITGWLTSFGAEKTRPTVPPAEIWKQVLVVLGGAVFGKALNQAISLSPEKDRGVVYSGLRP